MRVRRSGESFAHPLLVLVLDDRGNSNSRFAVTAGTSIGNAVRRNRAKRLLRSALRDFLGNIEPGYYGVLIARKPLVRSNHRETKAALGSLLNEAGIIKNKTDG
jgi:ribonuclease P protein component